MQRLLISTFAVHLVLAPASATEDVFFTPPQYIYKAEDAVRTLSEQGCAVMSWNGMDAFGMSGYPWVTTVTCPAGTTFEDTGVNVHGQLRFFLIRGSLVINDDTLSVSSESFWSVERTQLKLRLSGAMYVIGAKYELDKTATAATKTTSFAANRTRAYTIGNGKIGHDPHINNGTTNAKDITWSRGRLGVDPPSIAVLNCAPVNELSYVWWHSHPAGAMYIPYTGKICFQTDSVDCIEPGFARWTSANLFYYETFIKQNESSAAADALITEAGITGCERPVTFGVTNFDPAESSGQPNFVDYPENGGPQKWGTFDNLLVHFTTVQTKVVKVKKPEL